MTKGKLLASAMLVAAATAMAAGNANAVKLSIGGFGEFWFGYADNDRGTGADADNNFDVKQDAEFYFRGEETFDNGIKVGVLFELEAGVGNDNAGGSGFDETFAWVKTKWGQFNIGNNDMATGYVGGPGAVGPVGFTKSDASDWFAGSQTELNNTDVDLGFGDAQNITYFSPRVAGLQLIVSYTPDESDQGASDFDDQESGGNHQAMSAAVRYGAKFGKVSVNLNAGYTQAERADGGRTDSLAGFAVKGAVGFGPVTLTGAYAKEQINDTDEWWGISALYEMGKDSFSIGYALGTETQTHLDDNENGVFAIGYERNFGKGVTFGASAFVMDNTRPGTADKSPALNDGFGIVGGLKLRF